MRRRWDRVMMQEARFREARARQGGFENSRGADFARSAADAAVRHARATGRSFHCRAWSCHGRIGPKRSHPPSRAIIATGPTLVEARQLRDLTIVFREKQPLGTRAGVGRCGESS